MSYMTFDNEGILFHDINNKPHKLAEFGKLAANQSNLSQETLVKEVNETSHKLFDQTEAGMINGIVFLRIISRLMRKPQTHNVLHVGEWSPLNEGLANLLPQFNKNNFLWCYLLTCPVGKFDNVNFIFAKVNGGGCYVPTDVFDTMIFSEQKFPSLEVLLAIKDFGAIYFVAPRKSLPDYLVPSMQTFDFDKNLSIIELVLSPTLKRELRSRTPQGQLEAKKVQIRQTIYKMQESIENPNVFLTQDKNRCLDEYIAELTRTEKILNEIFPMLHSDTIKLNFNMFKEFLIDVRLYTDSQLRLHAVKDLNRQTQILLQDLNNL